MLIILAALVSLLPLTAKSRQGNSIRWSADEEFVSCEYFQAPSFSHVRTYQIDKITGVTRAPDSKNPSIEVVRMKLDGLNLNIPSQSSKLIWNFDLYLGRLETFIDRVGSGDTEASLTWYDPWLVVGFFSAVFAVVLWIFVFWLIVSGPPKTHREA
jgi:hypothetical protein